MSTMTPDPKPEQVALDETREYRQMLDAVRLLGDAMGALRHRVSPQMAAGVAETENAWQRMEDEFGLLDGREVARISGSRQSTGGYANDRRKARSLLGVHRANAYRYPGFQFDRRGHVYPSVQDVLGLALEFAVSDEDVAQWFLLGAPSLDGRRPVDLIGDADEVQAEFRDRFGAQW